MARFVLIITAGILGPVLAGQAAAAPDPVGPASAPLPADRALYERTILVAAAEKCRFFSPELARALKVGAAQAQGTALRAGLDSARTAAIAANAREAVRQSACTDPAISARAQAAAAAFKAYRQLSSEDFPGDRGLWRAARASDRPAWAAVEDASDPSQPGPDTKGRVHSFGLYRPNPKERLLALRYSAALSGPADQAPVAAFLVLRDPQARASPFLPDRAEPLRRPPAAFTKRIWAEDRRVDDGAEGRHILFQFPLSAASAIAALDPREAFVVALQTKDGVRHEILFEAGDFAAAWAFADD